MEGQEQPGHGDTPPPAHPPSGPHLQALSTFQACSSSWLIMANSWPAWSLTYLRREPPAHPPPAPLTNLRDDFFHTLANRFPNQLGLATTASAPTPPPRANGGWALKVFFFSSIFRETFSRIYKVASTQESPGGLFGWEWEPDANGPGQRVCFLATT